MAELDRDVLKREIRLAGPKWMEPSFASALIAALERADEVADQGCEECDAMVTDMSESGELHGHSWLCGGCANKRAIETSTIIWHLSDLLRLALERAERVEKAAEDLSAHSSEIREASWMEMARGGDGTIVGYKVDAEAMVALRAALEGRDG